MITFLLGLLFFVAIGCLNFICKTFFDLGLEEVVTLIICFGVFGFACYGVGLIILAFWDKI